MAYWYFSNSYDQLDVEDPFAFLVDRLCRSLKSIAEHFRPTRYSGAVRPLPNGADQLGSGVEFEREAPNGISVEELSRHLKMAADTVQQEGRPVLAILYVNGATRLAFPGGGKVVEDFVSSMNPGPWKGTGSRSYFKWLDEIIHFTAGDAYRQKVLDVAVKTDNPIWYHDWPGVDLTVARRIADANQDRLRKILRAVRTVLPNAKVTHHSEGPIPSTEDGFAG